MRLAFLFDIHANLPALRAVLADIERRGADVILHGGDLIGWGPQPNEVVAEVAERELHGVVGNHELLSLGAYTEDHPLRNASTEWTAANLQDAVRSRISALPAQIATDFLVLSHASPAAWHEPPDAECFPYVSTTEAFLREAPALQGAAGGLVITGHVHVPAVYAAHLGGLAAEARQMAPQDGELEVALGAGESLFVVAGAVGKPRDGVPCANYALLDTRAGTITLRRVTYDVAATCELLRRTPGLPPLFADELARGA